MLQFLLLPALLAGHSFASMAVLVLPAVAPAVARDYGFDPSLIGYQISLVSLGMVVTLTLLGSTTRRYGAARTNQLGHALVATGMLVLRAWLTRRGMTAPRRARVKHVIALAPATFGSPLAHKGRSFLGALVKGRKQLGPDFLEAGDQVLDALELGSRFGWELSHADLFGTECFYDSKRTTPYVFVFCGARGYRGLAALANSPGTDGTVRWAGCALNSRKIILDLSADCAENARVQAVEWTQDDVPMHPIANVDHGSILSAPPPALTQMVIDALRVSSRPTYAAWCERAEAVVRATREAMVPWQQFVVRAVDERGDRGLVEQERLGLLEKGETPHRIGGGGGLVQERVVGLVAPAGPVLAVAGAENFKEGGGVGEVGGPTEEAEGVREVLLVLKKGFLFEGLDRHIDPELALPHGLDGFHHAGLVLVVEHLHGDGGEILPAGKAGLGEEAAGFGVVEGETRAGDVGATVGRNHRGGGEESAVEDFL
jgi:hypothetical protein